MPGKSESRALTYLDVWTEAL